MSRPESSRLYERVARDLAAKILAKIHQLGRRLPSERELAQAYGVSRPTIREAMIALELDGLVEVRMGSGVYVIAQEPQGGQAGATDIGPFELLDARRSIEGEACALAAARITDVELAELDGALSEIMQSGHDIPASEDADRRLHLGIARATGNSAMYAAVEMLWDARARSPQYRLLSDKAHEAGVGPRSDEHSSILDALRLHDPEAARAAMRSHLSRVLDSLFEATEVHELEQARARVHAQRQRFVRAS